MNPWLSQTIMQALGWTLVHFLWQGLVIAALLTAGLRLFASRPAHYKYLAACAAMALMAFAPLVTFRLVLSPSEPLPAITPISAKISPVRTSEIFPLAQPTRAAIPESRNMGFFERLNHLLPWLVLFWLAGVCALSGRLFLGWLQVRRLQRTSTHPLPSPWPEKLAALAQHLGVSRPIRLLQSALIEVPTVIGWLRPVILLPASCLTGLTPGQLEAIIAHELAHIRRHDYLVNLFQSIIETLLFYHPAVWWVSRRIREERENCCDDLAVEVSGDLVGYARALATLEELRPASAQLMLAAAGAPLLQRIRRLAGQPERSAGRASWPVAGIAILLVLGILAAGRMEHRAAAMPQSAPETNTINSPALEVRTFHLDPDTPWQILQSHIAELCPGISNGLITRTNYGRVVQFQIPATNDVTSPLSSLFRAYFICDLMDFGTNTGKTVFFNESKSTLIVRGTSWDMARIENDLQLLRVIAYKLQSPGKVIDSTTPPITVETNADGTETIHVVATKIVINDSSPEVTNVPVPTTTGTMPLEVRIFHVDTMTFLHGLEKGTGIPLINTGDGGGRGPEIQMAAYDESTPAIVVTGNYMKPATALALRAFFADGGVQLGTNTGKVVIFNEFKGTLTVRATSEDLKKIEAAIQTLNYSPPETNREAASVGVDLPFAGSSMPRGATNATKPPEVVIEVKFVEIPEDPNQPSSPNSYLGTVPMPDSATDSSNTTGNFTFPGTVTVKKNPFTGANGTANQVVFQPGTATGLLTDAQFHATIKALEQRDGTDVLTAHSVVTESGRQAQLQSVDIQQTVTSSGLGFGTNGPAAVKLAGNGVAGTTTPAFIPGTATLSAGPTVDVIPIVSADGKSIDLTIIPSVVEFVGYDHPGDFARGDFVSAGGVSAPAVASSPPVASPTASQTSASVGGVTAVLPLPHFRLRQLNVNVTAWDGQTVVISGLVKDGSTNIVVDEVPLLGNMPVVGRLFRNESKQKTARKQLLIFVTVTLINPDGTLFHSDEERKALWTNPPPQQSSTNR